MRRSQQAFSVPSKQTQSSNAKDELSSTASINASSTTLIPSSKLLASKPRDCTLKREQNSCYEHDNGLGSGKDDLTTYEFNTKTAKHTFCKYCPTELRWSDRNLKPWMVSLAGVEGRSRRSAWWLGVCVSVNRPTASEISACMLRTAAISSSLMP